MAEFDVPVELDPSTRLLRGGRTLIGGSPTTILKLSGPFTGTPSSTRLGTRLLATGLGQPVMDDVPPLGADDLTVVVPAHDRPELLDRCLAALAPLSVIVVDDASLRADEVATVAGRHGATLLRLDQNVGPGGARNAGLRLVTTPHVAFVDSDVAVTPEVLVGVGRHLRDPGVVLAAPRVRGHVEAPARWFEQYDAAASTLDLGGQSAEVRPGSAVAYLPSACLVARVDALGNGFDESLRLGEDVDLVWRLGATGGRIRYGASTAAQHQVRTSISTWLARVFAYGSSAAPLAARHGDLVAPAILTAENGIAAVLLLARSRWAVPASIVALVASQRRAATSLGTDAESQREAARLSGLSLGWAVRQVASLAVRHWWPGIALAVLASRRPTIRRLLTSAIAVDSVVAVIQERKRRAAGDTPLDVPALLAGRRLDDLAYGAGVWSGAARSRSIRALRPRIIGRPASTPQPAP